MPLRNKDGTLYPVHVSVQGIYVGVGVQVDDNRSWFNYCPFCAKIWARGIVDDPTSEHNSRCVRCREHGGGSLLRSPHSTIRLPETLELMKYELELYFENPEAYNKMHGIYFVC